MSGRGDSTDRLTRRRQDLLGRRPTDATAPEPCSERCRVDAVRTAGHHEQRLVVAPEHEAVGDRSDLDVERLRREIATVVVWRVGDTAKAVFDVDDYESFVHIQSESAVRAMATSYPYDQHEEGQLALRSHATEVGHHLQKELQERLADAGVQVLDARISHLAYAPEIAQAMLQRQQANAIIAARTRIVAGAVGMVEMALAELQKNGVVHLDEERKAQMVSNLLVVLCGERATQPIVNTGSLY